MPTPQPVVLIHGLWIHSASWQPWIDLLTSRGYAPTAPGWPGDADTAATTKADPEHLAGVGIEDITARYAEYIATLPAAPIVIGHSFGGLIAQKLLTGGHARAAVAIAPGQIKGVRSVPLRQIRAVLPAISRPGNRKRAVALTEKQFAYGFGNTLTRRESDDLYARFAIPGPGRVLFEATAANLTKHSPAKVDVRTGDRGPLLMIAGGQDNTVPASVVRGAHALYRDSPATTELVTFPDRGHSLVFDHGWRDVAERTLTWLEAQGQ